MPEQKRSSTFQHDPNKLINWFAGLGVLTFNEMNEQLRSRNEEVLIPYTDRLLKGEKLLRMIIDGLRIPYKDKEYPSQRPKLPDLTPCTKIDIRYQPSMLEYFFPYDLQQSLLSPEEIHYLRTVRKIVLDDYEDIEAIIRGVLLGYCASMPHNIAPELLPAACGQLQCSQRQNATGTIIFPS